MVIPDQCRPVWAEHCTHINYKFISTVHCNYAKYIIQLVCNDMYLLVLQDTRRSIGSQLLQTLDQLALNFFEPSNEQFIVDEFSKSLDFKDGCKYHHKYICTTGLMVLEYTEVPTNYVVGISTRGNSITLPPGIFGTEIIEPGI